MLVGLDGDLERAFFSLDQRMRLMILRVPQSGDSTAKV